MKKNWFLLVLGVGLLAVTFGVLLFGGQLLNPPPTKVPVASANILAGTPIERNQFRLEEWSGVKAETLDALYLASDEFPVGAVALVDIPAGSPLYKADVDTAQAAERVARLTQMVKDKGLTVMALPVKPELGGNIAQPGDQVDLVFSIGALNQELVQSHPTPTAAPPMMGAPALEAIPTGEPTQTLTLPLSTLVLENIPVLQVEREQLTTQSVSGLSLSGGEDAAAAPVTMEGDTLRLYVAVSRPQAEALAFLLHNGQLHLAVHPAGLAEQYPGGVTWEDFEKLFFERRPTPVP